MIKRTLDDADIRRAAEVLCLPLSVIRAVVEVESPRGAFESDGAGGWRPTILFERHYFSNMTSGRFDGMRVPNAPLPSPGRPDNWIISSPSRGGYGTYSAQHTKLAYAAKLSREHSGTHDAAMMSASWGAFQIMGLYHAEAGHPTLQGFVNAMYRGIDRHLDAFIDLIRHRRLDLEIRNGNYHTFFTRYNGPAYKANKYDVKFHAARAKWAAYYEET